MPRKVFVAGEILTAADVNTNLMDQAVMRFATSAARGSAIPSPTEGMVTYLDDVNQVQVYNGSAFAPVGTVLQVVSTTKTDTFSASIAEGANTAVTGLTASITPSSTSSKILVIVSLNGSSNLPTADASFAIFRGATKIGAGDTASNRSTVSGASMGRSDAAGMASASFNFLDSPASVSSLTYSINIFNPINSTQTFYVNRTSSDTDSARFFRAASTITVMEVAG